MNWKQVKRWWQGECAVEGCEKPAYCDWTNFCWEHWCERMDEVDRERAQAKFDRQADVIAEGIRRAAERKENA